MAGILLPRTGLPGGRVMLLVIDELLNPEQGKALLDEVYQLEKSTTGNL